MEVLLCDKLPRSGFAGVRERRLIADPRAFGAETAEGAWDGFGNLVYLADARLIPGGQTELHDHHEIDVISLMVEGRLQHEGSLEHGQVLRANEVQVQRAGAAGFSHNEINPDATANRLVQIWVLPEKRDQSPAYRHYVLNNDGLTRVYGGGADQDRSLPASTLIDIAALAAGQSLDIDVPFLAYLVRGRGFANEDPVEAGTLLRGDQLTFDCADAAQLVLVHLRDRDQAPANTPTGHQ